MSVGGRSTYGRTNRRFGVWLTAMLATALLAGCAAGAAPSSPTSTAPRSTPTASPRPTDDSPDPIPLPPGHRTPAALPGLASIPYALGRTVHVGGYDFAVPEQASYGNPELVVAGSSLVVSLYADNVASVDLLSRDGRALQLSGAQGWAATSTDGTRIAAWYRPTNSRSRELAVYTVRDGMRVALLDRSWGDSYDVSGFDGSVVTVRHDGEASTTGYRWDVSTGALVAATFPKRGEPGWMKALGNDEFSAFPSPNGRLALMTTDGQELVGVLRTSDWHWVVSRAQAPRLSHLTGVAWLDEHTVLMTEAIPSASTDHSRVVTYDIATGRVTDSRNVSGDFTLPFPTES